MGGPPFSAALLVPSQVAERVVALPAGLADYSWRGDWPVEWSDRCAVLPATDNPGLLLRWQGALAEMDAFAALAAREVATILDEIGHAVRAVFLTEPDIAVLSSQPTVGADSESWTTRPSIFTFAVRQSDRAGWLDEAELRRIHQLLGVDLAGRLPADATDDEVRVASRIVQIGQPVALSGGPHPAALRLAIGARRIVAAAQPGGSDRLRRELADTIAKLGLIRRRLPA
jgi:hypothetical protein